MGDFSQAPIQSDRSRHLLAHLSKGQFRVGALDLISDLLQDQQEAGEPDEILPGWNKSWTLTVAVLVHSDPWRVFLRNLFSKFEGEGIKGNLLSSSWLSLSFVSELLLGPEEIVKKTTSRHSKIETLASYSAFSFSYSDLSFAASFSNFFFPSATWHQNKFHGYKTISDPHSKLSTCHRLLLKSLSSWMKQLST